MLCLRANAAIASPPFLDHRPCVVLGPAACGIGKSFAHRASVARSQARLACAPPRSWVRSGDRTLLSGGAAGASPRRGVLRVARTASRLTPLASRRRLAGRRLQSLAAL